MKQNDSLRILHSTLRQPRISRMEASQGRSSPLRRRYLRRFRRHVPSSGVATPRRSHPPSSDKFKRRKDQLLRYQSRQFRALRGRITSFQQDLMKGRQPLMDRAQLLLPISHRCTISSHKDFTEAKSRPISTQATAILRLYIALPAAGELKGSREPPLLHRSPSINLIRRKKIRSLR